MYGRECRQPAGKAARMPAQSVTIGTTRGLAARPVLLVVTGLCVFGSPAYSQTGEGKTPSCLGNRDIRVGSQPHLLGDWCGERTRLEQRGVVFDLQYVSDTLWGFKSQQNSQFASWNRFRATTSILASCPGRTGCTSTQRGWRKAEATSEWIWSFCPGPAAW
jgi:hypothetical protein